jgi:cytochrome subunit of sulfide dehydrogenase
MSLIRYYLLPATLLLSATAFAAPDPKVLASCNVCHGNQGVSTLPDVPTIAGISSSVQADALKAFKARTRPCTKVSYAGGADDMCDVAGKLSDADISSLADYYSKLPYASVKQSTDAAKAAAGKAIAAKSCEGCHTKAGSDPSDDAGLLAGQPLAWLKSAISAYKAGQIPQQKMMKEKLSRLSDTDVEALAQYYASLGQ